MKNKWIILLGLMMFVAPIMASADFVMPGEKQIDYCFQISNLGDYPAYSFVAYFQDPMGGHEIINKNECVSFYKFSSPKIYAIKSANLIGVTIPTENVAEKSFFATNKYLIASDLKIQSTSFVAVNDPLEKIVDVFKIVSLSAGTFVMEKEKAIYTYADGTTEEKTYVDQNVMPERTKTALLPWWFEKFWFVIVPIAALAVIIVVLVIRRLRK